jgi:hypothetical protein
MMIASFFFVGTAKRGAFEGTLQSIQLQLKLINEKEWEKDNAKHKVSDSFLS